MIKINGIHIQNYITGGKTGKYLQYGELNETLRTKIK